jgi:hypothetical protein
VRKGLRSLEEILDRNEIVWRRDLLIVLLPFLILFPTPILGLAFLYLTVYNIVYIMLYMED